MIPIDRSLIKQPQSEATEKKTWREYKIPMKETQRAYACYLVYRDLGPRRSLPGVIDYFQKKVNDLPMTASYAESYVPSKTAVQKWHNAFGWDARVRAYDEEMQLEKEHRRQERREKMDEEHYEIARNQFVQAVAYINDLIKAGTFGHTAGVAYAKMMANLQRVAAGAATERSEQSTEVKGEVDLTHRAILNPRDFTDDELEQLKELALALKAREQLR